MATTRKELKISSVDDLRKVAEGEVVELPSFSESVPFVARLRRPSMLDLVKNKKIPNSLLDSANKLFSQGPNGVLLKPGSNGAGMDELFDLMDVICEAAFVEPAYADLKGAGIKLTDDQVMFIFSYTQTGVKALEKFRTKRGGSQDNSPV